MFEVTFYKWPQAYANKTNFTQGQKTTKKKKAEKRQEKKVGDDYT